MLDFVLEEAIEGERGIKFQRRRCRRRAPRDVRAVEHRVILVDGWVRWLASQDQAGHLGRTAATLRHHLIDARAGTDLASGGQRRTGQEIAGLRAVNIPLERLGVVKAANEEHSFAKVVERRQDLAELQALTLVPGPPLLAVKTIAGE